MAKKFIVGYLITFVLAMMVAGGILYAQSPTPIFSNKGGVTPTPTKVPQAPSTGLGGGD